MGKGQIIHQVQGEGIIDPATGLERSPAFVSVTDMGDEYVIEVLDENDHNFALWSESELDRAAAIDRANYLAGKG